MIYNVNIMIINKKARRNDGLFLLIEAILCSYGIKNRFFNECVSSLNGMVEGIKTL